MYIGKNIFKTIMLKKQKYVFWKEHIQNNNVKKNRNMYFVKIILIKVCKIQSMFTSKSIYEILKIL